VDLRQFRVVIFVVRVVGLFHEDYIRRGRGEDLLVENVGHVGKERDPGNCYEDQVGLAV
jgi:hypothetical protein